METIADMWCDSLAGLADLAFLNAGFAASLTPRFAFIDQRLVDYSHHRLLNCRCCSRGQRSQAGHLSFGTLKLPAQLFNSLNMQISHRKHTLSTVFGGVGPQSSRQLTNLRRLRELGVFLLDVSRQSRVFFAESSFLRFQLCSELRALSQGLPQSYHARCVE